MKICDGDVAAWMVEKLAADSVLHQDEAATIIKVRFGDGFVYINENGNLGISKSVLRVFRRLTMPDVVWDRGERYWRYKHDYEKNSNRSMK
ncbi:hypothetical protein FRC96_08060 [Lujinxingia vulgaris]|uniref:Uncharacterized protein n=1 Tax=Lujinxingia vulgaris TaxID=2600176 RepID=A0A5C6XG94_9DELT|nr:hypothetical protein [Lujinxingia vulgaris]TXD37907.1 hypothetical protein FRC96_08060 [Lujinxingia vulgaris]